MKAWGAFVLFATANSAWGQVAPNLAAYLKAHPEEQGLAVSAELRPPLSKGFGLGLYNRKSVKVGGVTAIVPLEMIAFDETMAKEPNLYDGLPRDAKVLYLLTTLNANQWRKISGTGIGLNDLKGDQRNVFLSLLPKRIAWAKEKAGPDHLRGNIVDRGQLSEDDRTATLLRVERKLTFHVPLLERENAYTFRSADMEGGEVGQVTYRRNAEDEETSSEAFGVTVRSAVPNAPKKGQLDTDGLNAAVTLPSQTTVGAALASVSAATGRTILADARVRDRTLTWPGGPARAGDLLNAIAYAVEGTYRRVDGAYLLVADIVGAGTRKLRLTLWKEDLQQEVYRRQLEWRKQLAGTGMAQMAKFPANDPLSPSDEVASHLNKSPWDKGYGEFFPVTELTNAQRAFLDRTANEYKTQPVNRDKVGIEAQLRFGFTLPNGTQLAPEGHLGQDWEFRQLPPQRTYSEPPVNPMAAFPPNAKRPLAVRLGSTAEVAQAVGTAKRYGFTELWVDTERAEVLAAAITSGIPTRLFVRPWSLSRPKADSDRTLLGEAVQAVTVRQDSSPLWAPLIRMVRMQSWPRMGPVLLNGDLMSPFDPAWPARRNAIASLARTAGLAGVILNEVVPHGYEAEDDQVTIGGYTRSLGESWRFGYDERARLAFFKAYGVDPIDVATEQLHLDIDMQGAYFPAQGFPNVLPVDDLAVKWREFVSKANVRALNELRSSLPGIPVMADVRRMIVTQVPINTPVIAPWNQIDAPPSYREQYILDLLGGLPMIVVPDPRKADALVDAGNAYRGLAPKADTPGALDLTRVPLARWEDLLKGWIKPPSAAP